jgi:hypothetical protein
MFMGFAERVESTGRWLVLLGKSSKDCCYCAGCYICMRYELSEKTLT